MMKPVVFVQKNALTAILKIEMKQPATPPNVISMEINHLMMIATTGLDLIFSAIFIQVHVNRLMEQKNNPKGA